ncbi:CDP-alcohol phosphatidyltransferase family protein [Motilibacter sp. E257]|uniref:CDP-alcohol phosphatidyltransferase family protein n=1 Tax=Motilibacter deserti TaxID=2714956 RepID=A0ABX0GPF9_9ACTN|nr:CDP-alcohol phosphatidyltransferase family protein [Motilibacter deserti]
MPTREGYLARWAALHGGYDPGRSRVVRGWLTLTYALARPLAAARVPPDAVTGLGVAVSLGVPAAAAAGSGWPLLAALGAIAVAVADGLDGAVAVLTDRASRWGHVLDSVADRLTDCAFLLSLGLLGAPWPLVVAAVLLTYTAEYLRARAAAGGMADIGVVTVWERPSRVVVVCAGCVAAGLDASRAPEWAAVAAGAGVVLATVGLAQLAVVARRRLRGVPVSPRP